MIYLCKSPIYKIIDLLFDRHFVFTDSGDFWQRIEILKSLGHFKPLIVLVDTLLSVLNYSNIGYPHGYLGSFSLSLSLSFSFYLEYNRRDKEWFVVFSTHD